jgi:hypothetical protein
MKPSDKPSNSTRKGKSTKLSDPKLERLAKEVEENEYGKPSVDEPFTNEDSRLTLFSLLTPDDKKERIFREPGNEWLFEKRPSEGISFTGAVDLYRGDVSSALDISTPNLDDEEIE